MADTKTTALTELAVAPETGDLLMIVDDPGGTPASKKITVQNLLRKIPVTNINAQTDDYTLVLADAGLVVTMNKATANTLTIPANSTVAFPVGTQIVVWQIGAGATTVDGTTGVTVNGVSGGGAAITAQYRAVTLLKIATDTWLLSGAHGAVS